MTNNEKIRMEIRLDPVQDKDIIDFIDKYGSTRAGFIKQIIRMYKDHLETTKLDMSKNKGDPTIPHDETTKHNQVKKKTKIPDIALSNKNFD